VILKELADLARREGLVDDPDFEPKAVRWVVDIGPGGNFLALIEQAGEPDLKGKRRPKVLQVPRFTGRTRQSEAQFLVDKPEYVLGFDPDDSPTKRARLTHHRGLFADYVERALALAPDDPGLTSLLAFLRDDAAVVTAVEKIRGRAVANDLIAFRFADGGEFGMVHDRDVVRAAWRSLRHPSAAPSAGEEPDLPPCLCCGEAAVPVENHPQIKRIPGGSTSGIALVSANASAFESLGLEGTGGAPVCRGCADAYGTALNRLFHPEYSAPDGTFLPRRMFRLSEDTAVVYWTSGRDEHKFLDEFGGLDSPDPDRAGHLFEAIHTGKGALLEDASPFFALIITGGQGRATLRGYFESTVGAVAGRLREYSADIAIVKRYEKSPDHPPLSWLVRSLAAQGKSENVDPDLSARIFLAILGGSAFPSVVLSKAIARVRAEREEPTRGQHKHSRERMALIRATLNRQVRSQGNHRIKSLIPTEVSAMLDPKCSSTAYCLGRLFAVLEKLQGDAIGNPGATIVDRFYGAASATPATVFAPLLRKAQHHQSKLDGAYYPRLIQEILELLPAEAFPSTLSLEEQGLFALGYYHQKADLWRPRPKTADTAAAAAIAE